MTNVTWISEELASVEDVQFERRDDGSIHAHGHAQLDTQGEHPCTIDYSFEHDPARGLDDVDIVVLTPDGGRTELVLEHSDGRWCVDGQPRPDLDGCSMPDLGWTPVTNAIPMTEMARRGERERHERVAWVRYPELDVVANTQYYEHISANLWHFASVPYDFDIETDPDTELVQRYGDDLWVATDAE